VLETSTRLLALLSLFQAQRYWSGATLCERLSVTARTLRRDVDRLRRLGYPVNSTSGASGGYQLGAGATLPPLLLDDDEAVAVAVGLRTAASGTVTGLEEASVRALSKLQQVLPQRLSRRVTALQAFIVPLANPGPSVDAGVLSAIAAACRDCESLRFRYLGRDGVASERHVEPHRLVHTGRRWYLAAWDADREDWRTFRIDRLEPRIRPKIRIGRRFIPRDPPGGDFAAYVSKNVEYRRYLYQARVVLHVSIQAAAERLPPEVGSLEAIDEATCLLNTGASSLDALSVWLALTGFDFDVLEPEELKDRVRFLAARFARAAR
jgi:predicted DNA-binding transcriptional regulator YafY